jgi:thymidylate synthase (FAD)
MKGNQPMEFKSDKYPNLVVCLYDAPSNPEQLIAFSYLECIEDKQYKSPSDISVKEADKITEWVLKGGHTPSLETIHLSFYIRGMSRIVSHQLVRHRIGVSIGQRTQRANCEEYLGKFWSNGHFSLPPAIRELPKDCPMHTNIASYFELAEALYNGLVALGISQDDARYIIPHCAETSMTFTVAYKALMHICSVRLCHLMQGEMIEIVRLMRQAVMNWCLPLGARLMPNCAFAKICNRNENNPTDEHPDGICDFTIKKLVPRREPDNTFDLTKFSKDAS